MSKAKRILIGIGIVVTLLVLFYLVIVFWHGSAKPILAVADKFNPGSTWAMTYEKIEAPKIVCGEVTFRCPQVARSWRSEKNAEMTYEKFAALLSSTRWNLELDGHNCDSHGTSPGGIVQRCEVSGVDDGFSIQIYYSIAESDDKSEISLFVVKKD